VFTDLLPKNGSTRYSILEIVVLHLGGSVCCITFILEFDTIWNVHSSPDVSINLPLQIYFSFQRNKFAQLFYYDVTIMFMLG
jgi:hypothetical protein